MWNRYRYNYTCQVLKGGILVYSILLVDDDPFNLEFHTQIIKSLGYEDIETAIDGKDLLEKFKKNPEGYFEIIITSKIMKMPFIYCES